MLTELIHILFVPTIRLESYYMEIIVFFKLVVQLLLVVQ